MKHLWFLVVLLCAPMVGCSNHDSIDMPSLRHEANFCANNTDWYLGYNCQLRKVPHEIRI